MGALCYILFFQRMKNIKLSKPTFRRSQVTEHIQTEINFQRIVTGERTDRGQTFRVNGASGGEIPSSCRENPRAAAWLKE